MLELQLLANGIAAGSLGAGLAVGFTLILGVHRFWHLAHGAIFTWTAYVTYLLLALGIPILLVAALLPVVGGLIGGVVELGIYRWLRARGLTPLLMLLASLGLYIVAANAAGLVFGFDPRVPKESLLSGAAHAGQLSLTVVQLLSVIVGGISLVAAELALRWRPVGVEMNLVRLDAEMARVVGVRAPRARLAAIVIGSALVAWPALLTTVDVGAQPSMGLGAVLAAAIAAIVGGVGSVRGAYIGALLVGVAMSLPLAYIATQWQDAAAFLVLIVFMLIRPTGVFGTMIWKTRT